MEISRSSRRRMAVELLGILLVASAALLPPGSGRSLSTGVLPAAAAAGPTLSVEPPTGLSDGQYVKVIMTNFFPSSRVGGYSFRQCIDKPKVLLTDCTDRYNISGVTDDQGSGATYLPIYAGSDPGLKSANGVTSIVCDHDHPCSIGAFIDNNPATALGSAVLAGITFARSPDSCPSGQSGVLGSGSAPAYRAVYAWQSEACLPPTSLAVDYVVHNSHDGWVQFQGQKTDFGVTGEYPPPAPDPSVKAPAYKYAPLSASGLVVAYRLHTQDGAQVTNLTLTPDLIAGIFAGYVNNFRINREINSLNPEGAAHGGFPSIVHPFVRAEYSAETWVFTNWLTRVAKDKWHRYDYANGKWVALGAKDVFPSGAVDPGNYKTGARAVALSVVDPFTEYPAQGNIGFMDSSTAAFYGLPTVNIMQSDSSVVAATPQTIGKALDYATLNADGTLTADPAPHRDAWPLPLPNYMLAPTDTITPDKGATVAAFLKYAVQNGQKMLPAGYAPLPARLVDESLAVAKLIPGGSPAPTPTPSPSPTASPTPHPTATPSASSSNRSPFGSSGSSGSQGSGPLGILPNSSNGLGVTGPDSNAAATAASPSPPAAAEAGPIPNQHPASVPVGQGSQLVGLIQREDSSAARYLLPALALLGLFSLLGGAVAQAIARRLRP